MRTLQLDLVLIALALGACGDNVPRAASDAAVPPNPDAALQPVAIAVAQGGVPVAGVRVYFQNADSSLVSSTSTDVNGEASAVMAAGGFVTAIDPFTWAINAVLNPTDELYTYAGVKPGDRLQLSAPGGAIAITVILPPDTGHSETLDHYRVSTSCGQASIPVAASLTGSVELFGCSSADILVVSEDRFYEPLGYFYAPGMAVADQATIDFTTPTPRSYSGPATRTYVYDNTTPGNYVSINDLSVSSRGPLYLANLVADETSSTLTASLALPIPVDTSEVVLTGLVPGAFGTVFLLDWGAYSKPFEIDLGTRTMASFTDKPTINTSGMTMPDSGNMLADMVLAKVYGTRPATPPLERSWLWSVAAPYASTVTLPVVPTDVYDFNIEPGDATTVRSWMAMRVAGGYDSVRAPSLTLPVQNVFPGQNAIVGPSGSATFELWEPVPTPLTAGARR